MSQTTEINPRLEDALQQKKAPDDGVDKKIESFTQELRGRLGDPLSIIMAYLDNKTVTTKADYNKAISGALLGLSDIIDVAKEEGVWSDAHTKIEKLEYLKKVLESLNSKNEPSSNEIDKAFNDLIALGKKQSIQ